MRALKNWSLSKLSPKEKSQATNKYAGLVIGKKWGCPFDCFSVPLTCATRAFSICFFVYQISSNSAKSLLQVYTAPPPPALIPCLCLLSTFFLCTSTKRGNREGGRQGSIYLLELTSTFYNELDIGRRFHCFANKNYTHSVAFILNTSPLTTLRSTKQGVVFIALGEKGPFFYKIQYIQL